MSEMIGKEYKILGGENSRQLIGTVKAYLSDLLTLKKTTSATDPTTNLLVEIIVSNCANESELEDLFRIV